MPTVQLNIPGKDHRYEIVIEPGAIDLLGQRLAEVAPHAKAAAIIDHRDSVGSFAVPGDLRDVPGIGEATFQRLAELLVVR